MWISGPRKTFLLIQKFHKDTKTTLPSLQSLGSLLGSRTRNRGERAQCRPLQTFAEEVPRERGLLGEVRTPYRLYPHRVTLESVHTGITENFSPSRIQGWGSPSQVHGYHMG